MSGRKDAQRLLMMAEKDARALTGMGDPATFADEVFGFHAQQAVEKALKAWLAILGRPYPFRHDLGELLCALERAGQDVTAFWPLVEYTSFGVLLRYDALDEKDEPLQRAETVAAVQALLGHVTRVLGAARREEAP